MRRSVRALLISIALFLLALIPLVHRAGPFAPAQSEPGKQAGKAAKPAPAPPEVYYGIDRLPEPVRDLRDMLFGAIQSGDIEELRQAFEINDVKPDFRPDLGNVPSDPIAYWKGLSGDGEGREILAALSLILEAGYVVLPLGRDIENNRLFIWPYFAETPLTALTPAQEVELLRLVPAALAKDMKAKGRYTHWRLSIGADGSWHSFRKAE